MRDRPARSQLLVFLGPVAAAADAIWRNLHWWILAMLGFYCVSGTTVVRPDEVAVVLRWGRVVGEGPATQVRPPGPTFTFPPPIDRVVRLPVRRVAELQIDTLSSATGGSAGTIDPVTTGYALTGDDNIVQLDAVARYQISDPVAFVVEAPLDPDAILRAEVTAALVRSIGEVSVDRALSDGREAVIRTASARAQLGLDTARSGLTLTALELTALAPPLAIQKDFDAVQSAYIQAETDRKEALAYRERQIPKAQAEANTLVQTARADADAALARARGEASAFIALAKEYRRDPRDVHERLYRDAVDAAIASAADTRWVPPPQGARYGGLRISILASEPSGP